LRFGQVAVVVQGIPAVTAARFQLEGPEATMLHVLWPQLLVSYILCVQADHGPVIGHIPAQLVWDACHMLTDLIYLTSVLLEVAAVGCVMVMPGVLDIMTAVVLTVIFVDFLVPI
jgi:hypothetical protein